MPFFLLYTYIYYDSAQAVSNRITFYEPITFFRLVRERVVQWDSPLTKKENIPGTKFDGTSNVGKICRKNKLHQDATYE